MAAKEVPARFGNKHMVIFNYGSVVFFNFGDSEAQQLLYDLERFCVEPIRREVPSHTRACSFSLVRICVRACVRARNCKRVTAHTHSRKHT